VNELRGEEETEGLSRKKKREAQFFSFGLKQNKYI
jgi:hypothetical protein